MVNGIGAGEILGAAEVTWRFGNGSEQAVVFYSDDRDQSFSGTVSIAVFSDGVKVDQADNVSGNSWRFDGEASSNGGVLRSNLEFRISTHNNGVSSLPVVINVTRPVLT